MLKNNEKPSDLFYLFGVTGAVCAIIADFLIGNIDRLGIVAGYGIIREGYSTIPLWQPAMSMVLATIAFPLYLITFWKISRDLNRTVPKTARIFWGAVQFSSLGWLLLHAAYCWPIYNYRLLCDKVGIKTAGELIIDFGWAAFPYAAFFALSGMVPTAILVISILRKKTIFPRGVVFFSPFIIAPLIFVIFYLVLPQNAVSYCGALAIVNESLLLMFGSLLIGTRLAAKRSAAAE